MIWQKRVPERRPDWIETARVTFPSGRHADELCVTELAHVVWAANLATLEFGAWPSRRRDPERPDELRIDIDPQPGHGLRGGEAGRRGRARDARRDRLRRLAEDERQPRHPRLLPHRAELGLQGRAPLRARVRARDRAARARARHDRVVEGGARREGVRRLQPERARPHDPLGVLRARPSRRDGVGAGDLGRAARRRRRRTSRSRRCRRASPSSATCTRASTTRSATCACCSSGSSARSRRASARRRIRRTSRRCPASRSACSRRARRSRQTYGLRAGSSCSTDEVVRAPRRPHLAPRALRRDPCRRGSARASCRGGSGASRACRSAPRRRAPAAAPSARARRCPSGSARRSGGRSSRRAAAAPAPRSPPAPSRRPRTSRRSRGRRRRAYRPSSSVAIVDAAARLPAHADDDAVGRLVRLHLHDAVARARQIRQAELLRDHAVEARRLQCLQPRAALLDVVGHGRERRHLPRRRSSSRAPLLDRLLVHRLALPEQQVERDERRRDLGRQLAHAALGGMEAHLHRVEVELAVARDHDLAVERRVGRQELADRAQLREVAQQRPAVARPERELAAVRSRARRESRPTSARSASAPARELRDELRLHRRERDLRAWLPALDIGHCASLSAVRSLVALGAVLALAAGCGGSHRTAAPTIALLTGVHVDADERHLRVRVAARDVRTQFQPAGADRRVRLRPESPAARTARSSSSSFSPAATADAGSDGGLTFSYSRPAASPAATPGPVHELAKIVRLRGAARLGDRARPAPRGVRRAPRHERDVTLARDTERAASRPPLSLRPADRA